MERSQPSDGSRGRVGVPPAGFRVSRNPTHRDRCGCVSDLRNVLRGTHSTAGGTPTLPGPRRSRCRASDLFQELVLRIGKISALLATASLLALAGCKKTPDEAQFQLAKSGELNAIKKLPDFSLTERSGREFGLADLKGRVWVADFFYTTCPGPCAALSTRMAELQRAIAGLEDVRMVSISSDPEKDTPEVLKAYAERYQAGARWLFLTGKKEAIYKLANKGFLLSLTEDPANTAEPITHATRLVLVDKTGTIRGYYDGLGGEGIDRLLADIKRLLEGG